ncbi:MAG: hypothetical protein ACC657_15420 [Thiohalomonadales bacterium]
MLSNVEIWWMSISTISVINIGAWLYSARLILQKKTSINPDILVGRKIILWLSGGYVFICAFRSFLPRIDLERIYLVDSWLSSMIVGRSVATIAELFFIAQSAILLHEAGKATNDKMSILTSQVLIPLILIAEIFSWYAVLTTNYLGSVIEESLWTVAGLLLIASFIKLWPRFKDNQHRFIGAMIIFGIGFILFMITVDVPMYWTRWIADVAIDKEYFTLEQGFVDASKRYEVNFDWKLWREEIPWMTLYFTIAVWCSIYLAHAPSFKLYKNKEIS